MPETRRSLCAHETMDMLFRYEKYVEQSHIEIMRLCRIIEICVKDGELSCDKAERFYINKIRDVNKAVYRYMGMSIGMRQRWKWYHREGRIDRGSEEYNTLTRILTTFNSLSRYMFRLLKFLRANIE